MGPALIKYIKGKPKTGPKIGPKNGTQNGTTDCNTTRFFCKFRPHFCTSLVAEGGQSSKGSGLVAVGQGLFDYLR